MSLYNFCHWCENGRVLLVVLSVRKLFDFVSVYINPCGMAYDFFKLLRLILGNVNVTCSFYITTRLFCFTDFISICRHLQNYLLNLFNWSFCTCCFNILHRMCDPPRQGFVQLTTSSSLAAPWVVVATTYSTTDRGVVVGLTTFCFQWYFCI